MPPTEPAASGVVPVSAVLVGTIALQNAVPPFATDMYTPAFPIVAADLSTTASLVGLTLTAFFVGFAAGQFAGGPWSDARGRRAPLIIGALVCLLGAVGCALAPNIWALVAARVAQGTGGGIAAAVARAVIVDVARGIKLARVMSVLQALGGVAPMVAPVAGAAVITVAGWRDVFWVLAAMGGLMVLTAIAFVPESLPVQRRQGGGLRRSLTGVAQILRIRLFIGYTLVQSFASFLMMAYIANAAYVLQGMKGMAPLTYSYFFASTAAAQIVVSVANARLVSRFHPRTMIGAGIAASTLAVLVLAVGVVGLGTPLLLTCAGFLVIMASMGLIYGNSGALGAMEATGVAGTASAVQGVGAALANALAAPLASAGGQDTAVPMIIVMAMGAAACLASFALLTRPAPAEG